MARICINCGNEIPIMGKSYKLKSRKAEFCEECRRYVEPLLKDIQNSTVKMYSEIGENFDNQIEEVPLRDDIRKLVKKEFDVLYCERNPYPYLVRQFEGSFEQCYAVVRNAAARVQGFTPEYYETCIISAGDVKSASFLITDYTFIVRDSYAALAVNLLHHDNKATVSTIGANEVMGSFEKLDRKFWKEIEDGNPSLDIKIIRKPE